MTFDARFVDQARRDLASLLSLHPDLEEDDVLRQDMIEGTTNALELLDQIIRAERDALSMYDAADLELDRINKRRERFRQRQIALRRYIMQILEAANLKKVERAAATVSISAGRPRVVIVDESQIPDAYWRIKREPDKEAIGTTLKALRDVPGATLSNPEPVLRIS